MSITLPQNYRPTEREPFMNAMQQEYFRQKLLKWKGELIEESNQTLQNMQEESLAQPDLADRATAETDRSLELRTRDRFRKLISKIDSALKSIEEGNYGYCEETGEPISLKRLEARPIATLSVEAQERHERRERPGRGSVPRRLHGDQGAARERDDERPRLRHRALKVGLLARLHVQGRDFENHARTLGSFL